MFFLFAGLFSKHSWQVRFTVESGCTESPGQETLFDDNLIFSFVHDINSCVIYKLNVPEFGTCIVSSLQLKHCEIVKAQNGYDLDQDVYWIYSQENHKMN